MTTQTSKLKVEIDTTGERTKVKGLTNELKDLTTAGDKATKQTAALSKSIKLAGGAFAGLAGGIGISQVVQDVAQLQDINSRIGALTGDLSSSQKFLKETAKELSAEYITLAGGYSQLLPLYEAQIVSLKQVQDLTVGLANVQAKAGASNEALKLSMNGLSQALSAGNVNYEDYKQIVEPLPGLNAKIAASFGLTSGELKELISTGQLTSEEFGVKAVEALKKYDGAAAALAGNLTQTFNRTKNAYTDVVAAFSEPVGDAAVEGAQALADILELVADNADTITTAITAAGIATGVAFAGQGAAGIATYIARQYDAVKSVVALRAATVAETQSAVANAEVKVIQAANTQAIAAADLKAAQAKAASISGFKRLSFVAGELAVAERAAATATTQLTAAQTAATASAGKLAVAQRAATVSGTAMAAATRAASSAYALIGGPTGVAVAAAALSYYALKANDVTEATNAVLDATRDLNEEYARNGAAALTEAEARRNDLQRNINLLIDQKAKIINGTADKPFFGTVDEEASLRNLQRRIDFMKGTLDDLKIGEDLIKSAQATGAEFDYWFGREMPSALETMREQAKKAEGALDKLFPEDAKIAALREMKSELEEVKKVMDPADYSRAIVEIDKQIAKLKENKDAIAASASAARTLQSALDAAFPDQSRLDEFNKQYEALEAAWLRGGENAGQYAVAMAALQKEFDKPALDDAKEKADKLNEALSNRITTNYGDYADEVKMLNDALVEAVGNGDLEGKINLALANIDAEIRAELTVVEGDSQAALDASLSRQRASLEQFHAERHVSAAAAQADLDALNQDALRKSEDIQTQIRDRLASLGNAGEAITLDFDLTDTTSELARMLEDNQITVIQYHDAVEGAYQDHQDRLREIVRSGEGTITQIEAASQSDRLLNAINANKAKFDAAASVANELAGFFSASAEIDFRKASEVSSRDQQRLKEAESAYAKSATEKNKIALESAQQQAAISEAAAKKEFKNQQKFAIAQAIVAQGLTVAQAFASPTLDPYTKFAVAAASALQVATAIKGIRSASFSSSGSSYGSNGSSTGASFGSNNTTSSADSTQSQTVAAQERLVVFVGDFRTEEEAMFQVGRYQKRLVQEGYINPDLNNPEAFNNLPDRVVRLT